MTSQEFIVLFRHGRWYFLMFKLVDSKGGRGGLKIFCGIDVHTQGTWKVRQTQLFQRNLIASVKTHDRTVRTTHQYENIMNWIFCIAL